MAVTYKYNGVDPFAGICAPPLLSKSEEIIRQGSKIVRIENITLSGELRKTVCDGGLIDTYNQSKALILKFAENFKLFEIIENGSTVFSYATPIVESISFGESVFFDLIPFQIQIICYQNNFIAEGVLEPSEQFDYEEQDGCIVGVTHTVSARGFNTSNEALQNVLNFLQSRSGFDNLLAPAASGFTVADPIMIKRSESIDKMTGSATLTERYLFDKATTSGSNLYILDYTTEASESDGITYISINGTLRASFDNSMENLRGHFQTLSLYDIALEEYGDTFSGAGDLELVPSSFTVTENVNEKTLTFTISYHNNKQNDPFLIDSTTITEGFDGVDCISVSLIIRSIFGCPDDRLIKTKAYYQAFNLESYVATKWDNYGTGRQLGSTPKSQSLSIDSGTGDIGIEITYCTDSFEDCGCLENLNYSWTLSPAIPLFSEVDTYQGMGCYYVQDLNCNRRAKFSINGSARPSKCCSNDSVVSQLYSRVNLILSQYFTASDIILDAANIEFSIDRSIVSFSFSWNGIQSQQLSDAYVLATF